MTQLNLKKKKILKDDGTLSFAINQDKRINFVFSRTNLSKFCKKFVNQNFPSIAIFVFRETMKFLFTLQVSHVPAQLKLQTNTLVLLF